MIFSIAAPSDCSMPWSRGALRHGVLHRRTFRHGLYVTASHLEWQTPTWPTWNCPSTVVHVGWCTRKIHPRWFIRDDPPRKGPSGNTSHLRRSIRNAPSRVIHLGGSIRDRTPGIRMAMQSRREHTERAQRDGTRWERAREGDIKDPPARYAQG